MARRRIAVEIKRSGRLQHPMQFNQADGHHREISHHVVLAEERMHRAQQIGGVRIAGAHDLIEGIGGAAFVGRPVPSILERLDLCLRLRARR